MPRPCLPARLAAGALVGVLAAGAGGVAPGLAAPVPAPRSAPAAAEQPALGITIDSMTPGALPRRGPVVIEGSVTNQSSETWTDIKLYPFANASAPMTTSAELVEAAATDPETVVGGRILSVEDTVDDLQPGQSASYRLRVPRDMLRMSTPGIYWFGVHALGGSASTPSDGAADGRARTFLPYLPQSTRGSVDTAIVVPLRTRISHTQRGAVAEKQRWLAAVSEGGPLSNALQFGTAAGDRPMSWLLDPALPDAVDQLAAGNPIRSVQPTQEPGQQPSGTASPDEQEGEGEDEATPDPKDPLALAAQAWLDEARSGLRGDDVLALPYGDLDVAAAAHHAPALYALARERRGQVLTEWDLPTTPAVTAPSGYLNPAGLDSVDDDALVLMTDRMFPAEQFPDGAPSVAEVDGRRVAVTSYGATTGGPGPDARTAGVALRQRVLSEAAIRMLGDRQPLTVVVPPSVSGATAEQFWSGLDVPWLQLTTASDTVDRHASSVDAEQLTYPDRQARLELDAWLFHEVDNVLESGNTLQNLLTLNQTIAGRLTDEALSSVGYGQRTNVEDTGNRLRDTGDWVDKRLGAIRITAPPGVTLSSDSGRFVVTLANRLKQPVTVYIRAEAGEGASVDEVDPVQIPAGTRTSIQLNARTTGLGVHNVRLTLTDSEGNPLGRTATVPVRSGQVSDVIWVILGAGGGLLLLAIVIRLYRRIRGIGATQDSDTDGDTAEATPEPEPAEADRTT